MILIKPSVELLKQDYTLDGIYKQIELAGRICYKSYDKITEDSAKSFVDRMIKSCHLSVLEHGTVYLKIPVTHWGYLHYSGEDSEFDFDYFPSHHCINPYTRMNIVDDNAYITTNMRVLVEHNWLDDLRYICEPTEYHEKRITVKWTCDRGILAEFTRHRVFSFAAESTRYCNYSRDRFGNKLTFIKPCFLDDGKLALYGPHHTVVRDKSPESIFIASLNNAEKDYMDLINLGWKPQQARSVLPNALKTELVMTGFESDWDHFFDLRCDKAAHPDAQYLANMCKNLIKNNNNDRNA